MTGPCDSIRTVAADSKGKSTWRLRRKRFNFSFDVCTIYRKDPSREDEETTPYETMSCARLDNVVEVNVFYWQDSNKCAGILLKYSNGGQRALGQCRLGIDRVEEYTSPTYICFPSSLAPSSRSPLTFTSDPAGYREKGWKCSPMTGLLGFLLEDGKETINRLHSMDNYLEDCEGEFI